MMFPSIKKHFVLLIIISIILIIGIWLLWDTVILEDEISSRAKKVFNYQVNGKLKSDNNDR